MPIHDEGQGLDGGQHNSEVIARMAHEARAAMVGDLEEMVRIESPTFDAQASAVMADSVADMLSGTGVQICRERTDVGVCLVAELPGRADCDGVLLVGHTDTVWPRGTLDGAMPWSVVDGVARGPGAFDMKAGIVVAVHALRLLAGIAPRPIRLVLACDEEAGSVHSTPVIEAATESMGCALGFEAPHPDGALKVGRRGSVRMRIDTTGVGAHAALDPDKGVSAIDELMDQLFTVRQIVRRAGESAPVLCNVGTVAGGGRTNVIAESAHADIGLRFVDVASETDVLTALTALAPVRDRAVVTSTILSRRPTWQPGAGDAEIADRLAASAAVFGDVLSARPAAGAGDTNTVGARGVPTVDGFGPRGGGAHAADEHVVIDSMVDRLATLVHFVMSSNA